MSLKEELKQLKKEYPTWDLTMLDDNLAMYVKIDEVLRLLRVHTEKIREILEEDAAPESTIQRVLAELTTSLTKEQVADDTPNDFGWHSSDYKKVKKNEVAPRSLRETKA